MSWIAVFGGDDRVSEGIARRLGARQLGRATEAVAGPPALLVYLAASRSSAWGLPDLADADAALAVAGESTRVVLVSSARCVTPHAHHPGWVEERQRPPRGEENPTAGAWSELERRAALRVPADRLVILRPVSVPGWNDDPWRNLAPRQRVAVCPGQDPSVQLLSADDLVEAVALAALGSAVGAFFVTSRDALSLRAALRLAGARPVPVPLWVQRVARFFGRRRLAPSAEAEYRRFFWTVSPAAMQRVFGWSAKATTAACAAAASGGAPAAGAPPAQADDFGLDRAFIARHGRLLVGFLHDRYWRVEQRGAEDIPRTGGVVLVGVHRGFMPWDGVMALHDVWRATGRLVRFLIHPGLLRFPFLFDFMVKQGGVPASQSNAARLLAGGEIVGVFPEGIRGAFSYYRDAYQLGRAWRADYAAFALAHGAPIVPFATVGSAEIFPILGRIEWPWWRRISEWPFIPLTPTFPWLPVPLPTKWHTRYLEPIATAGLPQGSAAVEALDAEVRRRLEAALLAMRARRRSWWRGSVFEPVISE